MTATKVLTDLYRSADLDQCITKLVPRDHREDFKQELLLILCEKKDDLILNLYNTSGLTYYVVRVVLNLVNQKRNVYHRIYRDQKVTYDTDKINATVQAAEALDIHERALCEDREAKSVKEILNGLNINRETFYYRKLVEAVDEHGGVRAAAAATGIPRTTISRAMAKVREYLISKELEP